MESKKKHMKPVTQKKNVLQTNDPFLGILMWGTNYIAKELTNSPTPAVLLHKDFKAYTKVKIETHQMHYYNSLPKSFKFKCYCPLVFRSLRARFGVKEEDLVSSMCGAPPIQLGKSEGRSHAKFYVSNDRRYIIKTMSTDDVVQFHTVLESYYQFVVESEGQTLLPQYLSMFRVTLDKTEIYVIILRNIFSARLPMHQKFDLKGSEKNRRITEKERSRMQIPTLKDLDFKEARGFIAIGDDEKKKLMSKLQNDVTFLQKHNLMDYSLLIGIHNCKLAEEGDAGFEPLDGAISSLQDDSFELLLNDEYEAQAAMCGSPSGDEQNLSSPEACAHDIPDIPIPTNSNPGPSGDHAAAAASPSPLQSPMDEDPGLIAEEEEPEEGDDDDTQQPSSVPSIAELDLAEDVYAIASDTSMGATREVFYVGLVDILTYWGTRKKMSSTAKTVRYGTQANQSTINPDEYSKRFLGFIDSILQ